MNKTGFTLLHNRGGGAAGPGAEALLQVAGGGPGREAGLGARVRDAVAAEGAGHAAALGAGRGDAATAFAGRRRAVFRAFVLLRRAVTALLLPRPNFETFYSWPARRRAPGRTPRQVAPRRRPRTRCVRSRSATAADRSPPRKSMTPASIGKHSSCWTRSASRPSTGARCKMLYEGT